MSKSISSEISILIADDHPIFRQGLKQLIEKEPGLRVVAEADNGESAIELIKSHSPLVAILDLDIPRLDGFSVTRNVKELKLPTRVVVLTMHKDELHVNQAIDL